MHGSSLPPSPAPAPLGLRRGHRPLPPAGQVSRGRADAAGAHDNLYQNLGQMVLWDKESTDTCG